MIRRRELITLLGSAAAWPMVARAQQAMPVIGYLHSGSPNATTNISLAAFRRGLGEAGFVEGSNVLIEYRWAEGQYHRLQALAADLVARQVKVIFANTSSAPAAKAATATVPIVFQVGGDPIKDGLVASLNHPGGNLTGVVSLNAEVAPKRLELLHELAPTATIIGLLVNPTNPITEALSRDTQAAAHAIGLELHILPASTDIELNSVFATLAQFRINALVIGADAFLGSRSAKLAALAMRYSVLTVSPYRAFAMAGGLMGYGSSTTESYRLAGVYTGRILKGEKPSDLPVQQSTKVELIINLKTAKALGLTIPLPLLGRADEGIE